MTNKDIARQIFAELEEEINDKISANSEKKLKNLLSQSETGYVYLTGKEQAYYAIMRLIKQMREEYGVDSDETE